MRLCLPSPLKNMADIQITCINKPNRQDTHEGITHLGTIGQKWTRSQVIQWIDARTHTFYTKVGKRADIEVVQGPHGKYVRTRKDGVLSNDLLALPECP
jgi:Protein of unknown function (DUF3892)